MGRNGKQHQWGTLDPKLLDPTGGQVHEAPILPGYDGVPFRGQIPNVKTTDPEYRQPQVGSVVHIEILDLTKDEHLKRYSEVCQMIANGFGKISQERIEFDNKKNNWIVFIRWLEMFAYDPSKGSNHGRTG